MFNFHLCLNNSLDFYGCFGEIKSFLCSAFTGNSYIPLYPINPFVNV